MSNEREMTLSLRIKANIAEARKNLDAFTKGIEGVRTVGGKTFSVFGSAMNVALAPLKIFGIGALSAGAAVTTFGAAAIHAAAGNEQLRNRLLAVTGTAWGATKAMAEVSELAKHGFDKTDLVDAKIELLNLGITGGKSLRTLASTAGVVNESVSQVGMAVASLSERSLRRLGVDIKQAGDGYVMSFRDSSGKLQTIAAADATKARAQLLSILNFKFGGGIGIMEGSWEGITAGLRAAFKSIFGKVGDYLLPVAKSFAATIRDEIRKIADSDELKKWGKKAGEWLSNAGDVFKGIIKELPVLTENLRKAFADAPGKLGTLLIEAFKSGGTILITALLESWKSSAGILSGVGKIIAAAFMDEVQNLPGFGGIRKSRVEAGIESADERQLRGAIREAGIPVPFGALDSGATAETLRGNLLEMLNKGELSKDQQAVLSNFYSRNQFAAGLKDAANSIPDALGRVGTVASNEGLRLNALIKGMTGGYDFVGAVSADAAASRRARMTEDVYTVRGPGRDNGYINGKWIGAEAGQISTFRAPGGSFHKGDFTGGGVIINVQSLNVQANDTRFLQDQLIRRFGVQNYAPAGT